MAQGLNVIVTNGVPDALVRVNAGCEIGVEGETLHEGAEAWLAGPTAASLEAEGHVTIIQEDTN